jgi:hypothetical protein
MWVVWTKFNRGLNGDPKQTFKNLFLKVLTQTIIFGQPFSKGFKNLHKYFH